MKYKSKVLLAKIDVTEDTDPVPTGTDAALTQDLTIQVYQGNLISRNFDTDALGASSQINVLPHNLLSFGIEFAASGTAGTAAGYDAIMRACGLSSTNSAGISQTYAPISSGFETTTLYFLRMQDDDDHMFIKTISCKGNMSMELASGALPMYKFDNFMGAYSTPSQATAITADSSAYIAPVAVTKDNTPTVTLDSETSCLSSFTMNMGNQITRRDAPNCRSTILGDRNVTGNIIIKAPDLSVKNYYTELESHAGVSTVPVNIVHGTTAGNIQTVNLPTVQLISVTEVDVDGDLGFDFSYVAIPSSAGNDEFSIVQT